MSKDSGGRKKNTIRLVSFLVAALTLSNLQSQSYHIDLDRDDIEVSLNEAFQELDLDTVQHILVGETNHFKRINPVINAQLIQYFNQKCKINTQLIETGFSVEFLLNTYLEKDDPKILEIFESLDAPFTKYYLRYLESLKVINEPLPEERKIRFKSFDIEANLPVLFKTMAYILAQAPNSNNEHVMEVKRRVSAISEYRRRTITKDTCKSIHSFIQETVHRHPEAFRIELQEYLPDFLKLVEGLQETIPFIFGKGNRYDILNADWVYREAIYRYNCKKIYREKDSTDRYYSHLGVAHIENNNRPLTARLILNSENSPFKDHSIIFLIQGADRSTKMRTPLSKEQFKYLKEDMKLLEAPHQIVITNLRKSGLSAPNYFDFVILERSSEFKKN